VKSFPITLRLVAYCTTTLVSILQLSGCLYAGVFPIGLAGDGRGNVAVFAGHGGAAVGAAGAGVNCTATCVTSPESEACKVAMAKAQELCGKPKEEQK